MSGRVSGRGPQRPPGMPRWFKISLIVVAVLALIMVVVFVASGGSHGPARHLGALVHSAAAGLPVVS